MSRASYLLLLLLLSPLLLVGFVAFLAPIIGQRGKTSGTAYEPFIARLMYQLLGTRADPAALQLAAGLPATNWFCMNLMIKPLAWATRVSGYTPAQRRYPPPTHTKLTNFYGVRCEFLDKAIRESISAVDQVVILGAGWDSRAYGILQDANVMIYEVDAPATQATKRAAVAKAGFDTSHVKFVACDFSSQNWLVSLEASGFQRDQRTFILWEGVTMYLEEPAVRSSLIAVASLAAGSRVACDFLSNEWLHCTRGKIARAVFRTIYGEKLTYGFPIKGDDFKGSVEDYVQSCGLLVESTHPIGDDLLPVGGLLLATDGE